MVITITGTNDFARKAELDKRVAAFISEHTDMAVERLDGEEASEARMRESISSLPFLTARKLTVLREPGKQKSFMDDIAAILEQVADTTDLIIYEPKLDKRGTYYKTLKKLTDFHDFTDLDGAALARWAIGYAGEKGGSISTADAKLLTDRVGGNQQMVRSELEKLLTYNPHITRETIQLLTEPTPQSTIFELMDAAFAGRISQALELYDEQRALRVEPQAILALMAWQVHILVLVKTGEPRPADEIAKAAKLSPFVVRKSQAVTRKQLLSALKSILADLLALDLSLKRSQTDADEALRLFILKLGRHDA